MLSDYFKARQGKTRLKRQVAAGGKKKPAAGMQRAKLQISEKKEETHTTKCIGCLPGFRGMRGIAKNLHV
ncbi:hypothetical protein D3878_10470 [Noviherbaspirillum sedimenti]|uniref:Uncharacterized protein n=1 Tax=Noviherbaspirillum sedimenti TaxID=2320865 RepID=A0A3A3GLT8_9BURK|nr:hypothetical protein D3878_10470 [Noviherbaspirillum sedimenti]